MSEPETKKPNLKVKADLAGWLDKLGNEEAKPAIKIVAGSDGLPEAVADDAITGTEVGGGIGYGPGPGAVGGEADLEPGYVIADQYEIISTLGQGGMSTVYKATDLLMKRVVAVKCLHSRMLSDKTSILRFQKEAQAAGNLDHPHVVKIHQYGLDANKRPFLVMDYLEGDSLQERIDSSKLPVDEACRILMDAADGLEQAHKKGLVHRDFKPSNIMLVASEGEQNCVKIVDFGIAKVMKPEGEEKHSLTQTGEMLGSPNYMSPEQCMMFDLDNRSDIYAFGCTMFAAFTGRAPFSSTNLVEIYYKHLNTLPESISALRPDIKEAAQLDAVILKCMAKDVADRYQSMAEVKAAIGAIVDGGRGNLFEQLKERITLSKLKGKAEKKKKRSLPAIAAAAFTVFALSQAALNSGLLPAPGQKWHDYYVGGQAFIDEGKYKEARDYLDRALVEARGAGKNSNFVLPTVEELLDLSVITNDKTLADSYRGEISTLRKEHENAFPELDKQIAVALNMSGGDQKSKLEIEGLCQTINDQARELISTGFYDRALDILSKADTLATTKLEPGAAVQVRTLHNMATAYNLKGSYDRAYTLYKDAIAYIKKNLSAQDPSLVKALLGLATVERIAGRNDAALAELREAAKIVNVTVGPNSPLAAKVKVALAQFYTSTGNPKLAQSELKQAWAIYEKDPQVDLEEKARCAAALAYALDTKESFIEALKLQESSPLKEQDTLVWILQKLAEKSAGEQSADYYKRALAISFRLSPQNPTRTASLLAGLNSYYLQRGTPLEMRPWYEANPSRGIDSLLAHAAMYRQANDLEHCKNLLMEGFARYAAQKAGDDNSARLDQFRLVSALGAVNADLGMSQEACHWYENGLATYSSLSPEAAKNSGAADFFLHYESLLTKLGKLDAARELKTNHPDYFAK